MLRRCLCLVRAWSAAGLLCATSFAILSPANADQPASHPAVDSVTVRILDAKSAGDLEVLARGHGDGQVKLALKNLSGKRLNVVLPPGLVAANATGQGFQSMGLGTPSNRPGSFGAFRTGSTSPTAGFQSVGLAAGSETVTDITVPSGQTVELDIPAVCLNFGMPTPTSKDTFELVDVDSFSTDVRVRKALRSLAVYGTSLGTAQATMWRVCNGVPFEAMIARGGLAINPSEVALAARFVEALDASSSSELVDPSYFREARIFVTVTGEGLLEKDANRLRDELESATVLGLPARVVSPDEAPVVDGPALHLGVQLTKSVEGKTNARLAVRSARDGRWSILGNASLSFNSSAEVLESASLIRTTEQAVASSFVKIKPIRHSAHRTILKIENRLPFTVADVWVKAGDSAGAPIVEMAGVGVGPGRTSTAPIEAPMAKVERIAFNGL